MSTSRFHKSAFELANLIRTGVVSARTIVAAHIERIREVNGELNAVAADRFNDALAEADAADEALARGQAVGPLHGVPFTVKEMISVQGMPHTFGCTTRDGRVSDEDATVVYRLRKAGAIPVAVTNVPEWGFWFETHNLIYGRTSNPYDLARTSGGSSGGEGALVGAGAVPFGLGSDVGGSIRMPAAFCGIFGHKPTTGLVPLTGSYPVYRSGPDATAPRVNPFEVLGPLARCASDLLPLLRLLAGSDDFDPNINALLRPVPDEPVDWNGRRVLVLKSPHIRLTTRATTEIQDAVGRAAEVLRSRGAVLEELETDFFRSAFDLWVSALRTLESPPLAVLLGNGAAINPALELVRAAAGKGRFTLPALMFALLQWLDPRSRSYFRRRQDEAARLLAEFEARVGDGVLLMPVHPRVAPRHGAPLLRPFDFCWTGIFNVLGVPATTAPMGPGAEGLPLAVQIIGARGADALTIGAACALEEELGGWLLPERYSAT